MTSFKNLFLATAFLSAGTQGMSATCDSADGHYTVVTNTTYPGSASPSTSVALYKAGFGEIGFTHIEQGFTAYLDLRGRGELGAPGVQSAIVYFEQGSVGRQPASLQINDRDQRLFCR